MNSFFTLFPTIKNVTITFSKVATSSPCGVTGYGVAERTPDYGY